MAYTKEQAWELLTQYNKGEFHLKHANTVADVMRWYAEMLGWDLDTLIEQTILAMRASIHVE